jgi:hypothetical protein
MRMSESGLMAMARRLELTSRDNRDDGSENWTWEREKIGRGLP